MVETKVANGYVTRGEGTSSPAKDIKVGVATN